MRSVRARAGAGVAWLVASTAACQGAMGSVPTVSGLPARALGIPVFLAPEPTIGAVEDASGRPVAITLQHDLRDALEEAGFHLVPTPEAAALVARVTIQRVSAIESDLFIHGGKACGVELTVTRGEAVVATARPELPCVSSSSLYGSLPRLTATLMVNAASQSPGLLSVAESLHFGQADGAAAPVVDAATTPPLVHGPTP